MEFKNIDEIAMKPGQSMINGVSIIDKSSMMTYSKIVCWMCSAIIDANPQGICQACSKKKLDLSGSLPEKFTLTYCKSCQRFYVLLG